MFGLICTFVNHAARALPFWLAHFLLCVAALLFLNQSQAEERSPRAVVLEIQGAINPAVSDYLSRGMAKAVSSGADLIILRMDTPGGLDRSMRSIIQAILASPIPVVSYVAPEGARAASAGTYILYASHVAAMSPATNLGAATPISIGRLPGSINPSKEGKKKEQKETATDEASTLNRKVVNDASAYIRSLAERHGRNADWAAKAVREAVSLTADEAYKLKVIDIIASDLNDLLSQLDGRQVMLDSGPWTITTRNMVKTIIPTSWRYRLLSVISDPNVAYFLLLLGFYGLIYELANPGVFFPGVAGAISLLLAFYAFQILPINYSGLALIMLGLVFLISEVFIPSFGSLGIGGIAALVVGSLILIDDEALRISMVTIVGTSIISAVFILLLAGRALSIRKKKVRTGEEALIGMIGEAAADFTGEGRIWLLGESWQARSSHPITKGERVKVISRGGLELTVESCTPVKVETGE
jgi:membrane-bound serine protease (ClpP class)